ncbi:hypothetical protein ACSBR2_034038 [Camellia fascicularis]
MNLSGLSISFSLPPSLSSLDLTLSLCLALSILCFLSLMFFSDQQLCYVDILYPLQVNTLVYVPLYIMYM